MLLALRDALARDAGRPVRIEILARRLGTDPAALSALLDHARTRGLVAGAEPVGDLRPDTCAAPSCQPSSSACGHCPLAQRQP